MNRDRILYKESVAKTDRYTFEINTEGKGSPYSFITDKAPALGENRREATIIFENEKFYGTVYNFGADDCKTAKFWFEIQAAVADEINRIESNYMLDSRPDTVV